MDRGVPLKMIDLPELYQQVCWSTTDMLVTVEMQGC